MSHLLEYLDPLPGYAYTAVQDSHIRILEVLPGQGTDPIVCLIHGASLDEHPYYEALSYVWGDPPAIVSCIYIVDSHTAGVDLKIFSRENGGHAPPQEKPYFLQITATLGCALIRLRHPEQSRRLWVDAICINQKDLREQSTQVGMMTRIFGQAVRVVAHLGPEEDGSEILPSVFRKIHDHDAYRREQGKGGSLDHFWNELKMPSGDLEVWKPVWSFLDRPWYD
jgi:Heterokaryon incompatibility protein (HET)